MFWKRACVAALLLNSIVGTNEPDTLVGMNGRE
jgi:hypothetical protein